MTQTCRCCGQVKPLTAYHASKEHTTGLRTDCKVCLRARVRRRRRLQPARVRAEDRRTYQKNKAKKLATMIAYHRAEKARHPRKYKARYAVFAALRNGHLVRPDTCSRCGAGAPLDAHHPDYTQPLAVEWVCRPCHADIHRAARRLPDEPKSVHPPEPTQS